MRILMLSHHSRSSLGGATLADGALARALSRLGHQVDLLFYEDVLPPWIKATWRLLAFPWAVALTRLARLRRGDYDVIETTAGDAWVAIGLLRLLGVRRPLLSVRTHGLEHRRAELELERLRRDGLHVSRPSFLYHFRFRLWEVARDLRCADVSILLNHEDEHYAVSRLGLPAGRIRVIPNGVPEEVLHIPEPDGSGSRAHGLLFLGTWSAAKGADLLPRIAARLFRADPRFRLTCAGVQVAPEAVLHDFAPADRPRLRVVPSYDRAGLAPLLSEHGVLLFPSPAEGCSLALLEAMAGGLVPITTATGYALELIVAGENGFLAPAGDVSGFVDPALRMAADPGAALAIGRRARSSVRDLTWEKNAGKRLSLWRSLAMAGEDSR